jgi:hypothetical protein
MEIAAEDEIASYQEECDNGNWRVSFPLLQHVVDL